jgi:hypothetical protein
MKAVAGRREGERLGYRARATKAFLLCWWNSSNPKRFVGPA